MKRETPSLVLRGPLLTLALLLLSLTSCLTPESVDCPSGLVCPAGQKCAAQQDVCIKTDCGDGVVQAQLGETCDDGNLQDGDGCNRTCTSLETCGNNVLDIVPAGGGSKREACDDGNTADGDGCSADCLSSELCGNGVVDQAIREACDDGNKNDGDGCSGDCVSNELCGNNIVDKSTGEVCDDGNTTSGDKCSADCRSGEKCGNGIRDVDEQCDDGNTNNGDNCLTTCEFAICGDGVVDGEAPRVEQCDTRVESSTCNYNCTTSRCGDGLVNARAGEQCDDGDTDNGDGCTNSCRLARCGDGYVQTGVEECEPGLDSSCNYNCQENQCGDGIVNASEGEACDDGNDNSCGTCSSNCSQPQNVSKATARIVGVPEQYINRDNTAETFTFKSSNNELIFEFDKNDQVVTGRVQVYIKDANESDRVAEAIERAIKDQFNANKLDFRVSERSWNVVMLEYRHSGRLDSGITLTENVEVSGFSAEILTRGSGYDCSTGKGCMRNEDCKSRSCTIPSGQLTGTCN